MIVLCGVVVGLLYVLQPLDTVRAPIEWLASFLTDCTSNGVGWILGMFPNNPVAEFIGLFVAAATPGLAGLALNLVAPLSRMARGIFSIGLVLVSLGAFGSLPWWQASLLSTAAGVVGLILAITGGAIMEWFAAFMAVVLSAVQVRMLLSDDASKPLQKAINALSDAAGGGDETTWRLCAIAIALIPVLLLAALIGRRIMGHGRAIA